MVALGWPTATTRGFSSIQRMSHPAKPRHSQQPRSLQSCGHAPLQLAALSSPGIAHRPLPPPPQMLSCIFSIFHFLSTCFSSLSLLSLQLGEKSYTTAILKNKIGHRITSFTSQKWNTKIAGIWEGKRINLIKCQESMGCREGRGGWPVPLPSDL